MENIEYFATDLRSVGHSFFTLYQDGMNSSHKSDFNSIPFNPEGLPVNVKKNGEWEFYNFAGFTILAIEGSCSDDRDGSKSVFFIRDTISQSEFINIIRNNKTAMQIINKMPFEVKL